MRIPILLGKTAFVEDCREFLSDFNCELGFPATRKLAISESIRYIVPNTDRFSESTLDNIHQIRTQHFNKFSIWGGKELLQDITDLLHLILEVHDSDEKDKEITLIVEEVLVILLQKYENACRCCLVLLGLATFIASICLPIGILYLLTSYDANSGYLSPLYYITNGVVAVVYNYDCPTNHRRHMRRFQPATCTACQFGYNGVFQYQDGQPYLYNGTICQGSSQSSNYQLGQTLSLAVKHSSATDCFPLSDLANNFGVAIFLLSFGSLAFISYLRYYWSWKYGK